MPNSVRDKKAVTLIEVVILLLVTAIMGATIVGAVVYFVQLFIYSPRQLDTQKICQELSNMMIEGDQNIRGIRYARKVLDTPNNPTAIQFAYTYGYPVSYDSLITPNDQLSVKFRWDPTDKHIYRSTSTDGGLNWSAETVIPYYISSSTTVDGKDVSGTIFTYKKAADADWVPADGLSAIRRVIISINVKAGTGTFGGSFNFTSSAEIKGFQ